MTHLSKTDLWGTRTNRVATMPPGQGDVFVVIMIGGQRVLVEPVDQYDRAVRIADGFARRLIHDRPVIIRVVPMSLAELLSSMGNPGMRLPPDYDGADRQLVIDTCMEALRDCGDADIRTDAYEVLKMMGAVQ